MAAVLVLINNFVDDYALLMHAWDMAVIVVE